jgi:hypothetical protein
MRGIYLNVFADFVMSTSSKRATLIKRLIREQNKKPSEYNTFEDWLPIRNAIQRYLRAGGTGSALDLALEKANEKRKARYEALIGGFKKYRGKRDLKWVELPTLTFTYNALSVKCKPDVGIVDRGTKYFLKLHYGAVAPSNERVAVVAQVMRSAMKGVSAETKFGMLDLRRGTVRARPGSETMADAIEQDAEAFLSYWDRYSKPSSEHGTA